MQCRSGNGLYWGTTCQCNGAIDDENERKRLSLIQWRSGTGLRWHMKGPCATMMDDRNGYDTRSFLSFQKAQMGMSRKCRSERVLVADGL